LTLGNSVRWRLTSPPSVRRDVSQDLTPADASRSLNDDHFNLFKEKTRDFGNKESARILEFPSFCVRISLEPETHADRT